MLRRKLILRTGLFLLGSMAFIAATYRFPPLESDGMLVFCGTVFFVGLALAVWVERGALHGSQIAIRKRLFMTLVPVPWLLAALLVVNAKLDLGPVRDYRTRVIGKFSMTRIVPTRRLVVESWRAGHRIERVPVNREAYSRFQVGQQVVVEIHPGMGIPWVGGVRAPMRNASGGGSGGAP